MSVCVGSSRNVDVLSVRRFFFSLSLFLVGVDLTAQALLCSGALCQTVTADRPLISKYVYKWASSLLTGAPSHPPHHPRTLPLYSFPFLFGSCVISNVLFTYTKLHDRQRGDILETAACNQALCNQSKISLIVSTQSDVLQPNCYLPLINQSQPHQSQINSQCAPSSFLTSTYSVIPRSLPHSHNPP